ncbi:MAG TPA: type II secretion system protein GspM [Solirubrobacteraceae bacterium]|nr:type II secretion system protein GspM [Solirubrobacteraceae bacterium]
MTARDRLVIVAISALAVLAAVWMLLVSPERKKADKLNTEVSAASAQLATAESQASEAQAARSRYSTAYASVVNLGKAVPPSEEVPSLIYQLAQASNEKHVQFTSISTSTSGTPAPAAAASTSTSATGAAATTVSFTQMPFTFVFEGGFDDLYHLFRQLNGATVRTASGQLQVSGRLLTLQGVKLEPATADEAKGGSQQLTGTITATAYVLPASQGLTGGATATSPTPASASGSPAATSASSGSSSGSGSTATPSATIGPVR